MVIVLFLWAFVCLFVFAEGFSLCGPGCPRNLSVDKADLELRYLSDSRKLGVKV